MRVALFGGVFESPMGAYALSAPENVLRRFLEELGHEVLPQPSGRPLDLDAVSADVYHVHHFGTAACQLALAGVRPLVYTSHDPVLVSDFVEGDESRLSAGLRALVFRRADAVVALSGREAALLSMRFGVALERFAAIPNGLDLTLYGPAEERGGGPLELLSVGQLLDYKGYPFLFDALAEIVPRLPDVHLTIVSHRPQLRREYESRCRDLGIADRVDFVGRLETAALVERYRACDIYVQPSLAECFPVTVLEAMACGKPVVATAVGGVEEEVGDAGIVVPAGDASALARAIERLATDEEGRRAHGRAALERARTLYDGRKIAQRHVELYERLALCSRRPGPVRRLAAGVAVQAYDRRGAVAGLVPRRVRRKTQR